MATSRESITLTEEQVLFFRAQRQFLAGPGAPDLATAAHAIVGAQTQQIEPGVLALSMRVSEPPTLAEMKSHLFEGPRSLVRTWGQRETLFLFDAVRDWVDMIVFVQQLSKGPRGGVLPEEHEQDEVLEQLQDFAEPITRKSVHPFVPESLIEKLRPNAEKYSMDPVHLGAGRLLFALAARGDVCLGEKMGSQQCYVLRSKWFPDLEWPAEMPDPEEVAKRFVRRYLAAYGPATVVDIAHFFNAKRKDVRQWVAALEKETLLLEVTCEGREGMLALADDRDELVIEPPPRGDDWPLRLLPLYEALLMGHADKSFTVPVEAERKLVWRKAAHVMAVVMDRGRIVATWKQKRTRKTLKMQVAPMTGWNKAQHFAAVEREAEAVARHYELENLELALEE